MADLKAILGCILRDITEARVTSDVFAGDVSGLYRDDPILSAFPVPRLEIREATIDLRFAVQELQEEVASVTRVPPGTLQARIEDLVHGLLHDALFVDDLGERLREKGISPDEVAAPIASRVVRAVEKDSQLLERLVDAQPKELLAAVEGALRSEAKLWSTIEAAGKIRVVRQRISDELGRQIAPLAAALRADRDAPRADLRVKVAVTAQDLAEIPAEKVSSIRIVTEVHNYRWSIADEEGPAGSARLLPE